MDVQSCQYISIATQSFFVDVEKSKVLLFSGLAEEGNTVMSLSLGQTMHVFWVSFTHETECMES